MVNFTEKYIKEQGGIVRYIIALEKDRECWFFLKINPSQYNKYCQAIKVGKINDINKYGEIIKSGWGRQAPQDIIQELKNKFSLMI